MKPSRAAFLTSGLSSSCLTIGLCFCIVTSFSVPVQPPLLVLACIAASFLFSALFLLPKAWIWLLSAWAVIGAGGYFLRASVAQSAAGLLYVISNEYAQAIAGIQSVSLMAGAADADPTLTLTLLAVLYAFLCSRIVMRTDNLAYLLIPVLPVLALCLVILQTPPAAWAILLVIGSLSLLLLTQLLRSRQAEEGSRLALALAIPLAVLIALLALVFPERSYQRAAWSDSLQTALSSAADKLTLFRRDVQTGQIRFTSPISPSTLGSYLWDSSVTGVNLNRVGPQRQFGRSVMRVRSQLGGVCHLRGDSMAVYEDNRWKALSEEAYRDATGAEEALLSGVNNVSWNVQMEIETDMKSGIYYLPYYPTVFPEDAEPVYDAYVKNPSQQTAYSISYLPEQTAVRSDAYDAFVREVYTQVPDETRQALSDILEEIGAEPGGSDSWTVAAVLAYVTSSASYDLNTPAVPEGEDFVSWFLHDSETGYCVHFATAATILLRCLDIPARYVTGYNTTLTENEWTTVTSDDAHAWVEVYVDGSWYVLDPTPAAPEQSGAQNPQQQNPDGSTDNQTQPEPETQPQTQPNQQEQHTPSAKPDEKKHFSVFAGIGVILAIAAALLIWRALLFSIRKAAIGKGSCNRRAVVLYHHICWLSRQTHQPVPEEHQALAEKARFSHHKLTADELQPMQEYMERQTAQLLADKRILRRFLYRVLYALG